MLSKFRNGTSCIPNIPVHKDSILNIDWQEDLLSNEILTENQIKRAMSLYNCLPKYKLIKMKTSYNQTFTGHMFICALYIPEDIHVDVYLAVTDYDCTQGYKSYDLLYGSYNTDSKSETKTTDISSLKESIIKDYTLSSCLYHYENQEPLKKILELSKSVTMDKNFNREREIYLDGITYIRHTVIFPYLPFVNAAGLHMYFNCDTIFYMEIMSDNNSYFSNRLLWNDSTIFKYDHDTYELEVKYRNYEPRKLRADDNFVFDMMICDDNVKYNALNRELKVNTVELGLAEEAPYA